MKMLYISLQLPVREYRENDFMISTFFVIFFTVTFLICNYVKDHFPTMLVVIQCLFPNSLGFALDFCNSLSLQLTKFP